MTHFKMFSRTSTAGLLHFISYAGRSHDYMVGSQAACCYPIVSYLDGKKGEGTLEFSVCGFDYFFRLDFWFLHKINCGFSVLLSLVVCNYFPF